METVSREQLPKFEYRGLKLRINFNEEVVNNTPEDGEPYVSYKYLTAVMSKTAKYDERVECIIATKYPSYGAELSAVRKGGEYATAHSEFVEMVKLLASESFE